MKRVMAASDMAISAAGQTLYELARIGVPTIATAVVKNQLNNVQGWEKWGLSEMPDGERSPGQINCYI